MPDPEETSWRELAETPDPYLIHDPDVRRALEYEGWVQLGNSNHDDEQPAQATEDVSVASEETEQQDEPSFFRKLRALHKTPEWAKTERG